MTTTKQKPTAVLSEVSGALFFLRELDPLDQLISSTQSQLKIRHSCGVLWVRFLRKNPSLSNSLVTGNMFGHPLLCNKPGPIIA